MEESRKWTSELIEVDVGAKSGRRRVRPYWFLFDLLLRSFLPTSPPYTLCALPFGQETGENNSLDGSLQVLPLRFLRELAISSLLITFVCICYLLHELVPTLTSFVASDRNHTFFAFHKTISFSSSFKAPFALDIELPNGPFGKLKSISNLPSLYVLRVTSFDVANLHEPELSRMLLDDYTNSWYNARVTVAEVTHASELEQNLSSARHSAVRGCD